MRECKADYNLYYCTEDPAWGLNHLKREQQFGVEIHSLSSDPLFQDLAKGDLRLKPESPAFKLGFEPPDFASIGSPPRTPILSPLKCEVETKSQDLESCHLFAAPSVFSDVSRANMKLTHALCFGLTFGIASPVSAAIIGTNSPALPITAERIATLPRAQQTAWRKYLQRSEQQLRVDQHFLSRRIEEARS